MLHDKWEDVVCKVMALELMSLMNEVIVCRFLLLGKTLMIKGCNFELHSPIQFMFSSKTSSLPFRTIKGNQMLSLYTFQDK